VRNRACMHACNCDDQKHDVGPCVRAYQGDAGQTSLQRKRSRKHVYSEGNFDILSVSSANTIEKSMFLVPQISRKYKLGHLRFFGTHLVLEVSKPGKFSPNSDFYHFDRV